MKKWIRHEEPKEKNGLYSVWYDFGTGKEILVNMNKYSFEVAKIEKELIDKGYNEKDLERYRGAIYAMADYETEMSIRDEG